MFVNNVAISGDRHVIKMEAEKILKYRLCNRRTVHVECKNVIPFIMTTETISKSFRKYMSNIKRKAQNQRTTENSHVGHGTHTSESTDVDLTWELALEAP